MQITAHASGVKMPTILSDGMVLVFGSAEHINRSELTVRWYNWFQTARFDFQTVVNRIEPINRGSI